VDFPLDGGDDDMTTSSLRSYQRRSRRRCATLGMTIVSEALSKSISRKGPRNYRSLDGTPNDKPTKSPVEDRGIPHLAKNERDVGHPISAAGTGGLSFDLPTRSRESTALGMTKERATLP
jgi:hypothetical protein